MKKQSVILLLMLPLVLTAQKINFAAEVGFGASNVHTNEASGISNVSGFNAGVSARLRFSKKVCFNSGLFYSPKGAQRTISKQNSTVNTRRVINYFEFPANIIYYFNSETLGGLFVSGGMYAGVALGGYTRTTVTDSDREIKKQKRYTFWGRY
ncbi:porin family protein [Chryseobacterium sp. 1B4]